MKKALIICVLLLLIGGGLGFLLYYKKMGMGAKLVPPRETLTITPSETSDPDSLVIVNLVAGQTVTSPIEIQGIVPPGWMFEGSVPVILMDDSENIITQVQGMELNPGSWQSGEPVAFKATVSFATDRTEGYIVIQKNNPSGLPENAEDFRFLVSFQPQSN